MTSQQDPQITQNLASIVQEELLKPTATGWTDLLVGTHYGLWGEDFCRQVWLKKGYPIGALSGLLQSQRATAFTSTTFIWGTLRRLILARDGRCVRCGEPAQAVHHIVPVSRGGHPLDPQNLEGLCHGCHHYTHSSCSSRGVPAYRSLSPSLSLTSIIGKGEERHKQRHPLKEPGLLLKNWDTLYGVLLPLVGSPQRVEMVKEALRLQALTGLVYRSASSLARAAMACGKTWGRCLAALRAKGWARTVRLRRLNGQESVNLLDLSGLWAVVRRLLQRMICPVGRIRAWQKVRGTWWVKLGGAWATLEEVLTLGVSPSGGGGVG